MTVSTFEEAVRALKSDPTSRSAWQACVSSMKVEGRLRDHAAREAVYLSAKKQGLKGLDLVTLLLSSLSHEHRVAKLVDNVPECQFKLHGHDVGIRGGHLTIPNACEVMAIQGDNEFCFVAGRRLLIDMLMDPASVLPPAEGPTEAWRRSQIERYVALARELGLVAPPINTQKLGEWGALGISFGEAMTDVRGGDSQKWSIARFRVVYRGLVYRCRFVKPSDSEDKGFDEPDSVECDPRFATAPSGSVRYVAPRADHWGKRGAPPRRGAIRPFGHVVGHVQRGDMALKMQTPYDLLSAIRAHSSAWRAGPQRSPTRFMKIIERLGMRGWFAPSKSRKNVWHFVYEKFNSSLDVIFHEQENGSWKAQLQFTFDGAPIDGRDGSVWVRSPRRLYELVRDSYWIGADGRKLYKPGDVPPWVAAVHEERPVDDGVG